MRKKSIKGEDISNATLVNINEKFIEMNEAKNTIMGISAINRFLIVFSHKLNENDIIKIIKVIQKIVQSKRVKLK